MKIGMVSEVATNPTAPRAVRAYGVRRTLQLLIGLAFSAVLLWLTLRQVDFAEAKVALSEARWWFLVPAVLTYFVDLGVRAARWSVLLEPVRRIGWRRLYPVVTIGYMGNMLLPARLGELLRAATLGQREGIASAALGTIATERVLDGLTTVGILLVTSQFLPRPAWLAAGLATVTALFVGALLVLGFALMFRPLVMRLLERFFGRFAVARQPIRWIGEFLDGLQALRDPRLLARAGGIGLVAWGVSALEYYWIFRAFNLPLGALAACFSVSAVGLSTMIPSAPGYVGTFEFAGVAVLGALGIASANAIGAVVLVHLLEIVPVTVAGLFFAWREGFSLASLTREADEAA